MQLENFEQAHSFADQNLNEDFHNAYKSGGLSLCAVWAKVGPVLKFAKNILPRKWREGIGVLCATLDANCAAKAIDLKTTANDLSVNPEA